MSEEQKQKNPFSPYELQFSVQERKAMVAEIIRQLREAMGYQQKEVAQMLGISPQTYNGYEKGRNEPPIEVLVRISFLYEIPMDILVQRDRMHKDSESALITLIKMQEEIEKAKEQFKESPNAEVPQLNALMDMMQNVIDAAKTAVSNVEEKGPLYRK